MLSSDMSQLWATDVCEPDDLPPQVCITNHIVRRCPIKSRHNRTIDPNVVLCMKFSRNTSKYMSSQSAEALDNSRTGCRIPRSRLPNRRAIRFDVRYGKPGRVVYIRSQHNSVSVFPLAPWRAFSNSRPLASRSHRGLEGRGRHKHRHGHKTQI
jgi:hypothetical protein